MSLPLAESMTTAAYLAIAGKKEEALAELSQARDAGHRSPGLFGAIGHLQFELGCFDAAARAYEEALGLDRDNSTNHYNRGVCLEKLEAWEEAAAAFEKAVELDSRRSNAYLGLGIAHLHLKRPQEALAAFEKCLERQPLRETTQRGQTEPAPSPLIWGGLSIERHHRLPTPDFFLSGDVPLNRPDALDNSHRLLTAASRPVVPQSGLAPLGWDPRTVCWTRGAK
jgi:tetratricopeptide (TPR) repeat protein